MRDLLPPGTPLLSPDVVRARFSAAMSKMYREEVPAYGTLIELVAEVNDERLAADPVERSRLEAADDLARISDERHGAIRLGTGAELRTARRLFAVMGMVPVGYYDLSGAGVPVHSTAFRPVGATALRRNPFRVFTSLLRLDLIADADLRREAAAVLENRRIFTPAVLELIDRAEAAGGLTDGEADQFVCEALETFRWHARANVDADLYLRLHDAHRLIADVVSFRGPHINHLTPRTLDIDAVQARMPGRGISPKAVIEGPPPRRCPILLRQTSFKALEEQVAFRDGAEWKSGSHTARFGEIEQRGAALTPKGRALYDQLLAEARAAVPPAADGSNAHDYGRALQTAFQRFPDDWPSLRAEGLVYVGFSLTEAGRAAEPGSIRNVEALLSRGLIRFDPLVYEDFLPVSAAGIFQSNLGDDSARSFSASPSQKQFEAELDSRVFDEFAHYADIERSSLEACFHHLAPEK